MTEFELTSGKKKNNKTSLEKIQMFGEKIFVPLQSLEKTLPVCGQFHPFVCMI